MAKRTRTEHRSHPVCPTSAGSCPQAKCVAAVTFHRSCLSPAAGQLEHLHCAPDHRGPLSVSVGLENRGPLKEGVVAIGTQDMYALPVTRVEKGPGSFTQSDIHSQHFDGL